MSVSWGNGAGAGAGGRQVGETSSPPPSFDFARCAGGASTCWGRHAPCPPPAQWAGRSRRSPNSGNPRGVRFRGGFRGGAARGAKSAVDRPPLEEEPAVASTAHAAIGSGEVEAESCRSVGVGDLVDFNAPPPGAERGGVGKAGFNTPPTRAARGCEAGRADSRRRLRSPTPLRCRRQRRAEEQAAAAVRCGEKGRRGRWPRSRGDACGHFCGSAGWG